MRSALSQYLADIHELLRDEQRQRGTWPGVYLEQDLETLAHARSLWTERRVRRAPYGGAYYSGLTPETDLFVYDGPQFLHIEAKDVCAAIGRAIPTEFWARALDLHLGRNNSVTNALLRFQRIATYKLSRLPTEVGDGEQCSTRWL